MLNQDPKEQHVKLKKKPNSFCKKLKNRQQMFLKTCLSDDYCFEQVREVLTRNFYVRGWHQTHFQDRQHYCSSRTRHSNRLWCWVQAWLNGPDTGLLQMRGDFVLEFRSFIQENARTPKAGFSSPIINSLPWKHIRSSKLIPDEVGFCCFVLRMHMVAAPKKSCIYTPDHRSW